ncbi:DUF2497 domain-containing protein [Ancylobacter sp. VNQ12]|uniref:DUF2497 domain-containing protein n=1 Tax=Ancylobacter sp. VNQ12 TaxID=3400920 RepID=UPI003C044BD6
MEEILASIRRIISDEVAAEPQMPCSENPRAEAARPAAPGADIAVATTGPAGRNAPSHVAGDAPQDAAASGSSADTGEARVPTAGDPVRRMPSSARPAGAPRSSPVYSNYVPAGRPVAADPFGAHRRQASAAVLSALAASPVERAPVAEPQAVLEVARTEPAPPQPATVDDSDLDASLSAALFDLSLVEQAVQAELATMTVDAAPHVTTADDERSGDERSSAELPRAGHAEPEVAVSDDHPADASAAAPLQVPSAPETDDMQVQARPVHAPSRAAGSEPAEERRVPETRVPEAARPSEPRFLPAAARANTATDTPAVASVLPEAPSRLVSTATNAAVSTAFGTLARTVASNSRTVDDLVTEALRPMLKAWLDENLPTLVERLVRAEIERVARQGL